MAVKLFKVRFFILLTVCFLLVLPIPIDILFNPNSAKINRINLSVIPGGKTAQNNAWIEKGNLIAHALGGIDDTTYTNSLEAFVFNYDNGHRLFEVDLLLTSDNVLFAIHDWQITDDEIAELSLSSDYVSGQPLTYEQSRALSQQYTPLDFEDICYLMQKHDDIYIITDTKDTRYKGIKETFDIITETINKIDPKLMDRIIVQFYNQNMYNQLVKDYNFTSYIYTLYQSPDSDGQVIDFVRKSGMQVITMPVARILSVPSFVTSLNNEGCHVFTHTINDLQAYEILRDAGVYGIYTDFLTPYLSFEP